MKKTMLIIRQTARAIVRVFGIRREERFPGLAMLFLIVALNALVVARYYDLFTKPTRFYWPLFIHNFHISGFDPITYSVVSDWTAGYNVYRHPLLAFYMYIPYLVNQGLTELTGINCALFVVASMQIFCAFYSLIFFRRILRDVIGTGKTDSTIVTFFFFSFAYVMLSAIVPDHFIISMMLLLLTLHLSGVWLKSRRRMTITHTVVLFVLTAGVSLNNGLKTFLASLFVNGRRFFRPGHLLLAVIVPSALLWSISRWSYDNIVWPRDMARNQAKAKQKAAKEKKERERLTAQYRADSARIARGDTISRPASAPVRKKTKRQRQGRPISNGEFMRWTDITTPRPASVIENLFGESIQLHSRHLLEDQLRNRPMIVTYSSAVNYVVEALVVLLFVLGVWCGRRSRMLWIAMSWFAMDMTLHVGLGFGLNEVYIMAAHWVFVMPLATAFALRRMPRIGARTVRTTVLLLTAWLYIYNITLIVRYLC